MPSLTYVGQGENVLTFVPNIIGYARVVSPRTMCPGRPTSLDARLFSPHTGCAGVPDLGVLLHAG